MKFTYLFINLGSVLVPFLFSFHPKIKFNEKFRYFIPSNIVVAIGFIVWDAIFTSQKVWWFNPDYLTGYKILNLPLEEVLFFLCIPFSCVFTYHCINTLYLKDARLLNEKWITPLLLVFLFIGFVVNFDRLYTSYTFILLFITLILLKYRFKVRWLGNFYFIYAILLMPFLIVNGMLTGTGLEEPVVLYDNNENMGIRILTIPLEDVFYGMLLIILNVAGYHLLMNKNKAIN
jgi:lycopene cyclase domain-containing protein